MTSRFRRAVLVLVAALVLAACGSEATLERATPADGSTSSTALDSDASSTTTPAPDGEVDPLVPSTPLPPTSAPTTAPPAPVRWESCGAVQCASVAVPLDHDDPTGPTIDLGIARRPATGDAIGPLVFNFGGPGATATNRLSGLSVPAEIRERFDLIAVDPRGVGRSERFECGVDPVTLYSLDPTFEDAGDEAAYLELSRDYVEDCATTEAALLPHLGTRDVARDLDVVRAALGAETISFVGYSYGTVIGQVYAELFPARARAVILDGVVDPALGGIEAAIEQGRGSEVALSRWAAGCTSRSSCPFTDADAALAAVDEVLARSESGIASSGGARTLSRGDAHTGISVTLYSESFWPRLDAALADALAGDAARLVALADTYARLTNFSVYFGVNCLDSRWPAATDEFIDRAEAASSSSDRFGTAVVIDYVRCALWPVAPEPIGPITAPDAPPILVVSTTGDPATPYENGVRVAQRLRDARLLTHEGDGHVIVFRGNGCVDATAMAYLLRGDLPGVNARC